MTFLSSVRFSLATAFSFLIITAPAQAPGNVSAGLRWWLKANAGVYSDAGTTPVANGGTVREWDDQSNVDNDASQASSGNRPTYRTNRINGYPTLEFTGNHFLTAGSAMGVAGNESFYMFVVLKQNSYLLGATDDGFGSFILDRGPAESNNLMSLKMVTGNRYAYQKRSDNGGNLEGLVSTAPAPTGVFELVNYYRVYGSAFGLYLNGRLDATLTTNPNDNIGSPPMQIGRHAVNANQGMNGEVGEIILYDASLTTANRQRIESYLALKYGITLDTNSPQNYVRSDGTVLYPTTTASYTPYRYDVAGIIRDDNSALNQSSSRSQNANYVVTVSNPSAMANTEALVWGSNNSDLTTPTEADVDGTVIQRRLSRVWRFQETGNVGTVTISFDLSAVPGPKVQSDLRLLVDTDDDGFADNNAIYPGTLVGDVITFTGINFDDADNVTIGTTNKGSTPLPVELVDFKVRYEEPHIRATWKTASELNNDYFTLERSLDGFNFSEVGRIAGKGTSHIMQSYSLTDEIPAEGRSYYRLKQTDFDGTYEYSDLRVVIVGEVMNELSVWPNPSNRLDLTISRGARALKINSVNLIGMSGSATENRIETVLLNQSTYQMHLPEDLPSGIYILQIRYDDGVEFHKISITR